MTTTAAPMRIAQDIFPVVVWTGMGNILARKFRADAGSGMQGIGNGQLVTAAAREHLTAALCGPKSRPVRTLRVALRGGRKGNWRTTDTANLFTNRILYQNVKRGRLGAI